jgi:N-acetyl-alpha-D-muramate 1-phosphate uridylyltransferase
MGAINMQAMILAAGYGRRLRPWTSTVPKALLTVANKALIVRHIENCVAHGFTEVVINVAHLADTLVAALGDGQQFGIQIHYSREPEPYGTAGGIRHALKYLRDADCLVINADVLCDYPLHQLPKRLDQQQAHLVLVDNPADNLAGDFSLVNGYARLGGEEKLTFSGIGVYQTALFANLADCTWASLGEILRDVMCNPTAVTAEHYCGQWHGINDRRLWQDAIENWQE